MVHYFPLWSALTASSAIALASIVDYLEDLEDERDVNIYGESSKDWATHDKWVASAAAASVLVSLIGCIGHLFIKNKFKGTMIEGGLITIIFGLWAAALPALLDPENQLAVAGQLRGVFHPNIYFSSWGSFILSLVILTNVVREFIHMDFFKTANYWVYSVAASIVVMCSAVRIWNDADCDDDVIDGTEFCKRTTFAVSLGAVAAAVSAVMVFVPMDKIHLAVSMIMLIVWCFGISYVTFESGPATDEGTLYFSTWVGFFLSLYMASMLIADFLHGEEQAAEGPVETLKDVADPDQKLSHVDDESEDVETPANK